MKMKVEESQDPLHGENESTSIQQWYRKDPSRYKEELDQMSVLHPDWIHSFDNEGNAVWEGIVRVEKITTQGLTYSPKYNELKAKFCCLANYPYTLPRIIDVEKVIIHKCPHTQKDGFCYSFGPETELDFIKTHRLVDLYKVTQQFLVKQSIYEDNGIWPDGQFHGENAFIYREYVYGPIDPNILCYCGIHGRLYKDCHMRQVEDIIQKFNLGLRRRFGKRKLGPNDKCVCSSGKKYKKCCQNKYFLVGRKHFIQLYPELKKKDLLILLQKIDEEMEKRKHLLKE